MAPAGISAREFARRDGCAHTLVNRAVKSGHLKKLADGTLDPAFVGTGWREENRRSGNGVSTGPIPQRVEARLLDIGEDPVDAAARIMRESGATLTLAD